MNNRILLYASLILGLAAAAMNWIYLNRVEGARVSVAKARRLIRAGETISADVFQEATISGDIEKLRGMIVPWEDIAAFDGKPLTETLEQGQLLMLRSFQLTGGGGIRDSIAQNERALSIEVRDEAQAVAYLVRPGYSVDVWGYVKGGAVNLKPGACVRAVGDAYSAPSERGGKEGRYRTVTIVVSESDVPKLIHNLNLVEGRVTLTLRSEKVCKPDAYAAAGEIRFPPIDNTRAGASASSTPSVGGRSSP